MQYLDPLSEELSVFLPGNNHRFPDVSAFWGKHLHVITSPHMTRDSSVRDIIVMQAMDNTKCQRSDSILEREIIRRENVAEVFWNYDSVKKRE